MLIIRLYCYDSSIGKRCDNCFESDVRLLSCKGCGKMFYCDKTCQTIDWASVHASECNLDYFKNPPKTDAPKIEYLRPYVIRLWAHLRRNPAKYLQPFLLYNGNIATFTDVLNREEGPFKDTLIETLAEEMSLALQKEGVPESECPKELLRKLGLVWSMYSYPIPMEGDTCYIGTGIYIQPLAFTHSCAPTAFTNFHDLGFMEIRAIAPIPKGTQPTISLFHSYSHINFTQRSVHLVTLHRIHCKCLICNAERANGDLINYTRLRNLMEGQLYARTYEEYLCMHNELLPMLRRIYYEFDPRITFRFVNAVINLNKLQAPYGLMERVLDEAEAHLLITKGKHHYDYGMVERERETARYIEQERRRFAIENQRKQKLAGKSKAERSTYVKDERDVDEIVRELEGTGDSKKDSSSEDQSKCKGKKKRKRNNNKNKKQTDQKNGQEAGNDIKERECKEPEEDHNISKADDDHSKGILEGDKESKAKKRRERKKRTKEKNTSNCECDSQSQVVSEVSLEGVHDVETEIDEVESSNDQSGSSRNANDQNNDHEVLDAQQLRTEAYRRKNISRNKDILRDEVGKVKANNNPYPTPEEMEEMYRLLDEIAPSVEFNFKNKPSGRILKIKVE